MGRHGDRAALEKGEKGKLILFPVDYASPEEVSAAAADMVERLESEGIVLLKNNGTLPLSGTKVTLMGRDAADPIYGGSGSGSVDVSTAVNAKAGLENAGFAVNPSGRTVDIWAADFTKDPTFVNFGRTSYSNMMEPVFVPGFGCHTDGNFFVQYEEGIYMGYRYYETAAVEGFIDYDEAIVYPFGHGLSYTSFDWKVTGQRLGGVDGQVEVDVTVTNTGSAAGKDVVELYYSAPYTKGGIEKSSVVLGDFAKTKLSNPARATP